MDRLSYTQSVSRIKVLETRLLNQTQIDRMLEANSPEEVLKFLQETEYGGHFHLLKRPQDYDKVLSEELKRVYSLLDNISPDKILVDILRLKYDYHNLKVLIKGKALEKDLDYLLMHLGTVEVKILKEIVDEENYVDLTPLMREAVERANLEYRKDKDPQIIDLIFDKYLYEDMLYRANNFGVPFITEYIKINIDLINIKTLFRCQKQKKSRDELKELLLTGGKLDKDVFLDNYNERMDSFVQKVDYTDYVELLNTSAEEYQNNGKLSSLEKYSDNFLTNYVKESKFITFGPEALWAYAIAKETEVKNVRIILVGKINCVDAAQIRERLRDTYV